MSPAYKPWVVSHFMVAKFWWVWYNIFVKTDKSRTCHYGKWYHLAQNQDSCCVDGNPHFVSHFGNLQILRIWENEGVGR